MESAEKREILVPQFKERGQVVVARQLGQERVGQERWSQDLPISSSIRVMSNDLDDQEKRIKEIRNEFQKIRKGDLSKRDLAFAVRDLLELIVKIETGISSLERGIELFLEKLCGNPAIRELMKDLYRQGARELQGITPFGSTDVYDQVRIIRNLDILVEWYAIRSESLVKLGWFEGHDNHFDQIFDLTVFQSRKVSGIQGLEARCGLALFGRLHQPLWVKIFLLRESGYVQARGEWSSWVDDVGVFIEIEEDSTNVFSVSFPITPSEQRFVADQVNFFIPYAALDLAPGRYDLTVEAALFDERGNCLTSVHSPQSISIPYCGRALQKLVSYHSMGIWPHDIASGDKVTQLRVALEHQQDLAKTSETIRISSDLEFWGHEGEELTIEARLYRLDGASIECKLVNSEETMNCSVRRYVVIEESVEKWFNFESKINVDNIILDEFPQSILVELCILNSQEKVLAGALQAYTMPALVRSKNDLKLNNESVTQENSISFAPIQSKTSEHAIKYKKGVVGRTFSNITRIFSNRPLE